MKINTKIISIATLALLLNACGGGNSTGAGNNTAADGASGTPVIEGKLIDAPVAGVKYMCGEITNITGNDGGFICDTYPVRFYAGGVKLGEIYTLAQDGYVTPQDLLGLQRDNYEDQVAHLALFLQSLDDDGDIESVITLDKDLIKKLKDKQLDIKNMSDTQLIELLDGIDAANNVSREDALRHLRSHMAKITSVPTPTKAGTDQTPADTTTGIDSGTTNGTSTDIPTQERAKRFSVDSKNGIVTDTKTDHVWQNTNIGHGKRDAAIERCQSLEFAGITDWRLPTSADSKLFHAKMNAQGDKPKQAFDRCVAEVTSDGYVKTKRGAQQYGGKAGDSINFSGGANIRCISDSTAETTTPSPTVTPEPAETSTSNVPKLDDAVKQAYLDVINDARSESHTCGKYGLKSAVPALKWNDALYKASWQHSNDLAQTNTFSHTGSGKVTDVAAHAKHSAKGSTPGERIVYNGYTNWRTYGENIAAGTVMDEAQEAIDGWLKSPGHCVNLMSPNFKEVGMAHVLKSDSHYTHYWTQDFGAK